jgi:DeoR/GlpR family transcriptional regulator of sugar metabolism
MTERQRAIMRMLAESGSVMIADIAERFEISAAAARRDAMNLAQTGQATRSYGGLHLARSTPGEQHYEARALLHPGAKMQIARTAAEVIPHRGDVFVDAGTTCFEVARVLGARPGLRIYTNSIPVMALAPEARANIIGIGGEVRKVSLAVTGGFTQPMSASLRFDAAVIGASSLDLECGAYTTEFHEAAVKTEALRRATQRLLVADAGKWDRSTAVCFAPWNAFSTFVTNQDLSRNARLALAASGVSVRLSNYLGLAKAS